MVGEMGGLTNKITLRGGLQMSFQHMGRRFLRLKVTVERSHCCVCIMFKINTIEPYTVKGLKTSSCSPFISDCMHYYKK